MTEQKKFQLKSLEGCSHNFTYFYLLLPWRQKNTFYQHEKKLEKFCPLEFFISLIDKGTFLRMREAISNEILFISHSKKCRFLMLKEAILNYTLFYFSWEKSLLEQQNNLFTKIHRDWPIHKYFAQQTYLQLKPLES